MSPISEWLSAMRSVWQHSSAIHGHDRGYSKANASLFLLEAGCRQVPAYLVIGSELSRPSVETIGTEELGYMEYSYNTWMGESAHFLVHYSAVQHFWRQIVSV